MRNVCICTLGFLLCCSVIFGQNLPPVVQDPSGFGALPDNVIGGGIGFNNNTSPRVNGWLTFGRKVQAGTYATVTSELTGKTSSVRAGIEQVLYRFGPFVITAKGDAGVAVLNATNVGGAFAGGGSVFYDISKPAKLPGAYLVGSIRALKTALNSVEPVFYFGVIKTF